MSRLFVALCSIFLIHQYQVLISSASEVDVATFFDTTDYISMLNEISAIKSAEIERFNINGVTSHHGIVEKTEKLIKRMNEMIRNVVNIGNNYDESIFKYPLQSKVRSLLHTFRSDLNTYIDSRYIFAGFGTYHFIEEAEEKYINGKWKYFKQTLDDFPNHVENKLRELSATTDTAIRCDEHFSVFKTYLNASRIIIILELGSYLMYAFAVYVRNNYYHWSTFDHYDESRVDEKATMITSHIDKLRDVMSHFSESIAPGGIYECTKGQPIRGEETLEFEGVLQKFIVLEPDMNYNKCPADTCSLPPSGLASYEFSLDGYRRTKPCQGKIQSCVGVEDIEICYADDSSIKRYEGLSFNRQIYGKMNSCPGGKYTISSWRRWFAICDVCLCTCNTIHRNTKQTQTLSYAEQTSDIEKNMVVTNVKFVEKNKTIYIQIEQESLSVSEPSNGDTKREWKPINDKYAELKQVHSMQSFMHLDDIIVPGGHLVTGVKFGPYEPPGGLLDGAHHWFQIRIRATPYDPVTNKLIISVDGVSTSFWVTPQTMDKSSRPFYERDRTSVFGLNIGDRYEPPVATRTLPDSTPNQYLAFRPSDLQDDAGQSTIPYFDSRPAFSKAPFPLMGVGISLKTYSGPVGYLTLKTIPYLKDSIMYHP